MTKRKTKPKASRACDSTRPGSDRHGSNDDEDSKSKQSLIPTLKMYGQSRDASITLPDVEALKKADKMYHHLVYTSYDEEELLKELKSGKFAIADTKLGVFASATDKNS